MEYDDGFIQSFKELKVKQWYSGPPLQELDRLGQRLYFRSGDLAARLCLNGESVRMVREGEYEGACMLLHAERYLSDRLVYELYPWPKGMMKVEST